MVGGKRTQADYGNGNPSFSSCSEPVANVHTFTSDKAFRSRLEADAAQFSSRIWPRTVLLERRHDYLNPTEKYTKLADEAPENREYMYLMSRSQLRRKLRTIKEHRNNMLSSDAPPAISCMAAAQRRAGRTARSSMTTSAGAERQGSDRESKKIKPSGDGPPLHRERNAKKTWSA